MTSTDSFYDWELRIRTKPHYLKKKKKSKNENCLGISTEDFKKYIKLWKSKNIAF